MRCWGSSGARGCPKHASWTSSGRASPTWSVACSRSPAARRLDAPFARALGRFEAAYLARVADRSRPYPGVVEGLERLRAARLPLGCVTNKASRFTLPLLAATGLSAYFGTVVSGDQVERKKPEPDALLLAARRLGVDPRHTLVIGDSGNDVKAARAAGCPVVVVPYGYREGVPVEALGADAVVQSVEAAAGWITMAA